MMLIKQTVTTSDTSNALFPIGRYVDLGTYKNYIYMGKTNLELEIYLCWDPSQNPLRRMKSELLGIYVKLGHKSENHVFVEELLYLGQDNKKLISFVHKFNNFYEVTIPDRSGQNKLKSEAKEYSPLKFYRFSPEFLADLTPDAKSRYRKYPLEFEAQVRYIHYLGPLRKQPVRFPQFTGVDPNDLGQEGAKTGDIILNKNAQNLVTQTNKWLKQLDIAEIYKS